MKKRTCILYLVREIWGTSSKMLGVYSVEPDSTFLLELSSFHSLENKIPVTVLF